MAQLIDDVKSAPGGSMSSACFRTLLLVLTVFGFQFSANVSFATAQSDPTLIAYWPLDVDTLDATGHGNDAAIVGALPATGKIGGAYWFNGFEDALEVHSTPALNAVPAGPHSYAAWIYIANDFAEQFKFIIDASNPPAGGYLGDQRGLRLVDGHVVFKWVTDTASFHATSRSTISAATWHHLVGTFDGSEGRLYVDGVLEDAAISTGTPTITSIWKIGNISAGGTGNGSFPGLIDDVRVYGRAVSEAEVLALFHPIFEICPRFDQSRAYRSGSTVPVRIQLCDTSGSNVSSPDIQLTALSLVKTSSSASIAVEDAGQANPDADFRYSDGQYVFNLSLKGLDTGTYNLIFTASGDPLPHAIEFQVR